jgi:hypothetical protein
MVIGQKKPVGIYRRTENRKPAPVLPTIRQVFIKVNLRRT